jgi:hypothetical protein
VDDDFELLHSKVFFSRLIQSRRPLRTRTRSSRRRSGSSGEV